MEKKKVSSPLSQIFLELKILDALQHLDEIEGLDESEKKDLERIRNQMLLDAPRIIKDLGTPMKMRF